jgi:hypothetical protein
MPPRIEINLEAVMKSLVRALPILLLVAVVAILYARRQTVPPPAEPASDIRSLQEQRDRINAQLDQLEHGSKNFLPRGSGSAPGNPTPDPNHEQPAAPHNN